MFAFHRLPRLALGLAAAGAMAACSGGDNNEVLGPNLNNDIFKSYVAIGNSITAGYQSGGITDATQRQSYAFLLAQQMGTRFAYPSLNSPGCPPPVINFQTQARPTGTTATTCALRAQFTDILNNVGVPGAWSHDPSSATSATSNTLTSFILGGKTQVEKALDADPTFVSVWIGNNDVLGPAVSSGSLTASLAGMTPQATFEANYKAITDTLVKYNPDLKGVLIGVVNVVNAPVMFPAAAFGSATFKATFDAIACSTGNCVTTGGATLLDASCTLAPGNAAMINTFLAHRIAQGQHPSIIACTPGGAAGTFPAPIGDAFVLTTTEQATVTAAVNGWNAFISAKAASLGWAYVDPNTMLATLRTAGTLVRNTPLYCQAAPCTNPTAPFGTGMSLDGAHPGALVHRQIANTLIPAINAKYGTTLALVP